jgi:hypothetical protein
MTTSTLAFGKALLLGCVVCAAMPIACGDTEETPPPKGDAGEGGGGSGGSNNGRSGSSTGGTSPEVPGISDTPKSVECGGETCASAHIPIQQVYVDPCCAGPDEDQCGLDTGFLSLVGASFEDTCQAKGQEGPVDEACPSPTPAEVPLPIGGTATLDPFPGCCRAETGTCGVLVNNVSISGGITVASFGFGCVDSAPFFPGEAAIPCGSGSGGAGASAGAGAGGAAAAEGGAGGAAAVAGAGAGGAP